MLNIREIVHQFETATTRSGLIQALQAATSALGYEFFSVTVRLVHIGGGAWRILLSSMPREFLNWYDQEQILDEDPILRRAMDTMSPFYADELDPIAIARSPKAQAFMQAARKFGVASLLASAQQDHEGAATILTVGGSRVEPPDREGIREQVAWLVAHVHEAITRIVVAPVTARRGALGKLTRLERSMLELLARGHGAREISQMLAVSSRSVRYHALRVREKLGASSLNQAVSRAIESRQITLCGNSLPSHWSGLPRMIFARPQDTAWSIREPTFEMSLREVRAASTIERLAQGALRGAAAEGFSKFAFLHRSTGLGGSSPLVFSNDPAAQGGFDNPGPLLRACTSFRNRPSCVPWRWGREGAGPQDPVEGEGIACVTLGTDGSSSVLVLAATAEIPVDPYERRHRVFQLARTLHERACALTSEPKPSLSEGDLQALRQMVNGSTIRKVAVEQRRRERTLRYQLTVVARKLGARNSRHALAIATERGLLPRDMGRLLSRELIRPFAAFTPSSAAAA